MHKTLKGVAVFVTLLLLFRPAFAVNAHPADMYIQSQSIVFDDKGMQLDWKIVPGPVLADGVWAAADQDQNGNISPDETRAWVEPFLSEFTVELDGSPLGQYQIQRVYWPANVEVLRTGEDAIEVLLRYTWPVGSLGKHAFVIHNAHLEANSLNMFTLQGEAGLTFEVPGQNNGRLQLEIYFPNTTNATPAAGTSRLTSWNSGTPNLPSGFSATISKLANNLVANPSPPASQLPEPPANGATAVTSALVGLVKTQQFSPLFLIGAFLLSLALGSLHALTPGHGKALVAAYLVGSQGRTRDAIFLGTIVTITHTGSVLLLGLITLLASHYILPMLIIPWLELISGLFVIAFGLNLLLQRRGDLASWLSKTKIRKSVKVSPDVRPRYEISAGSAARIKSITPLRYLPHDHHHLHSLGQPEHHDHSHHAEAENTHAAHSHDLPGNQVTLRSLLTLGISGGLVPCPDAIAILLVAVAVNRVPFGMLLIVAFSIGLALVLIAIGIAMVQGVRWIGRTDVLTRFGAYTPVLSAVVVSGLGIALTLSALNSFKFASSVLQPPSNPGGPSGSNSQAPLSVANFDLSRARLLYVAADRQGADQLFMLPLSGGSAVQYTQEADGLTGYALSPDQKTILYTVFNAAGGSSIWAINTDRTQRRLLLECPQSECNAPKWYPDGQKVAYERLDDTPGMSLPRFSIWWLDLKTGKTEPVFQDGSFASSAPAFSPDGQWFSYISAASNTIIIYNLKDGRSESVPLGSQEAIPETWGPGGDALLFGNRAQSGQPPPLHVKLYMLASGQIIDLGGPDNQTDFSAAWSPDGQWIAIDRNVPSNDPSGSSNQLWLVRPDGTHAHVLLNEAHASYSHLIWSPDGRSLIYSRYTQQFSGGNFGHFDVYSVDIQTGKSALLVPNGDLATPLQ